MDFFVYLDDQMIVNQWHIAPLIRKYTSHDRTIIKIYNVVLQ